MITAGAFSFLSSFPAFLTSRQHVHLSVPLSFCLLVFSRLDSMRVFVGMN